MVTGLDEFLANQWQEYLGRVEDGPPPPGIGRMSHDERVDCRDQAFHDLAQRNERRRFAGQLVTDEGKRDALMRRFIIEENDRILEIYRRNFIEGGERLLFTAFALSLPLIFICFMLSTLPR